MQLNKSSPQNLLRAVRKLFKLFYPRGPFRYSYQRSTRWWDRQRTPSHTRIYLQRKLWQLRERVAESRAAPAAFQPELSLRHWSGVPLSTTLRFSLSQTSECIDRWRRTRQTDIPNGGERCFSEWTGSKWMDVCVVNRDTGSTAGGGAKIAFGARCSFFLYRICLLPLLRLGCIKELIKNGGICLIPLAIYLWILGRRFILLCRSVLGSSQLLFFL